MSWTAYDDPEVARKMTGLALGELGRWIAGDHEFHEPWKVFVRFVTHIRWVNPDAWTFLDVGCAAGYYRAILRTEFGGFEYLGVDRSAPLIALARKLFESDDFMQCLSHLLDQRHFDIVLSGSVLQHTEDWQSALREQIRASERWLIIHKIPIASAEVEHHTKTAYGVEMDEWHFPVQVINEAVSKAPVMEHYFHSNPPHWSGLYDLST